MFYFKNQTGLGSAEHGRHGTCEAGERQHHWPGRGWCSAEVTPARRQRGVRRPLCPECRRALCLRHSSQWVGDEEKRGRSAIGMWTLIPVDSSMGFREKV